jgi:Tol biopolymer transport system component
LEGTNANPVWSPDGKRIAFRSNRDGRVGVYIQNADGTGSAEELTKIDTGQGYPFSWSPDGNYIVFVKENRSWSIALNGERKVAPVTEGQTPNGGQFNAAFSPDGRWVALASSESRPPGLRIYVQQFPTGAKYQVSRELANAPVWSRDGKELIYHQTDTRKLVSVRIQTLPSFSVSEPVVFPIDGMIQPEGGIRQYDVLPDGRILVLRPAPQPGATEQRSQQRINVVLNWYEELKKRVPSKQ